MSNKVKINFKGHLFRLLFLTFLLLVSYAVYKNFAFRHYDAHYGSNILLQYANVYKLTATIHYPHDEKPEKWKAEIIQRSQNDIKEFCYMVDSRELNPTITSYLLQGDMVPKWIKNKKTAVLEALTEFKCQVRQS